MIISDKKKFIFIHVYKTGGTSVRTALRTYRDRPGLVKRALDKLNIISLPTHALAKQIKAKYPIEWERYFTFAFVRNPWSWQVSLYSFTLQAEYNHHHDVAKSLGSFREYLYWRVDGHKQLLSDFIFDDEGKRIVDYVGRIETVQHDFREICNRIGVDVSLPHKNKSQHRDYREYYDDETRELVAKHFASDIDAFGYNFDGVKGGVQIN